MVRGLWVPRVLPVALIAVLLATSLIPGAAPRPGAVRPGIPDPSASPGAVVPSGVGLAPHPAAGPTLSVPGLLPTAASLSWSSAVTIGFDNYTIYQSSNSSHGPWEAIGFVAQAATTTLVAASLTPGGTYWWEVAATTSSLLGGTTTQMSNVASATTPGLAYLNVTLSNPTTAVLNWTNNATYAGGFAFDWYDLFEAAGTAPPALVANATSVSTHQTSLSPLSPGASYAFYVATTDCTTKCGTATPTTVTTQSNWVTLGTPETLAASINGERSVIDVGQPDLFTCTPSGGKSPYAISWNNGNGTFEPGPGTESVAFNATGAPSVQCKIRDADASTSVAGTSVDVNAAPVVLAGTNRSTADVGGPIAFHCTASGGTAPIALTWVFGDGGEAGLGNTTHAYAQPAEVVATCTATDFTGTAVGRSSGLSVSSDPDVYLSASSAFATPGTVLTFHATAANGSGNGTTLAWTFGDGAKATGPTSTHAFAGAGRFDVSVRTVDSNGVPAVANTTVAISPIAVAVTAPSSAVTTGAELRFNATASGGAGAPYNFSWSFGDGSHAYGPAVTHTFHAAGKFAPVLLVTDRLGAVVRSNLTPLVASVPPTTPTPPGPFVWILVAGAIALLAGTFAALILYRRSEADAFDGAFGWVPYTGPNRTVTGVRVCRNCGTPNNAAREGCSACGAPITPSIFG